MKRTRNKDSTSEAIRERYARILGLDDFPVVKIREKSPFRRQALLLIFIITLLLTGGIGAWFFFKSPLTNLSPVPDLPPPAAPVPQAGPAASELSAPPEAGPAEPPIPTPPAGDDHTGASPLIGAPPGPDTPEVQSSIAGNDSAEPQAMNLTPTAPAAYLVVLLSTKSQDEAIERARELNGRGYASEVILSASGYYGVALRGDSYDQAAALMKTIVASGITKTAPYIMTADRVKERIYPEKVR
ncbi:MAG: hypothetical protein ACU83V_04290 [Gammaproteobacteria bacterium]